MGRVQTARHDGLLRRLFSIKGGGSLMAETLGDAFPVIQLEGGPVELLKLAGWELGMGGLQSTSPVAQTNAMQILNPAGSGKLVVPTTFIVGANAASTAFLGLTDVVLATASVGRQRDTREGVTARTAAILRTGNAAVAPIGAMRVRIQNAIDRTFEESVGLAVLAPGTALTFVTIATNIQLGFGCIWRERTAEPSELSF